MASYKTKSGDTLDKIVQKFYAASPLRSELLRDAVIQNNPKSFPKGNAKSLVIGSTLSIPDQVQLTGKLLPIANVSEKNTVAAVNSVNTSPAATVATPAVPAGGGGAEIGHVHVGTTAEVGDGLGVGIHIAAACATFDGHVADGHALFHGHAVENVARVFISVADAAVRAEQADDVEDDVLRIDSGAEVAVHLDAAHFHFLKRDGLRGENVADLAGADAESDRAERAVSRRVRVAASDRGAGLGDALLGSDDVDDALFAGGEVEIGDPEIIAVLADRIDHHPPHHPVAARHCSRLRRHRHQRVEEIELFVRMKQYLHLLQP